MQRAKTEPAGTSNTDAITKKLQSYSYSSNQLYGDMDTQQPGLEGSGLGYMDTFAMANKLGMGVPNLAPDVDMAAAAPPVAPSVNAAPAVGFVGVEGGAAPQPMETGPKKKKYAKEAWPGRKPQHGLLV